MAIGTMTVHVPDDVVVEVRIDGEPTVRLDGVEIDARPVTLGDGPPDVVLDATLLRGTLDLYRSGERGEVVLGVDPPPVIAPPGGVVAVDQIVAVGEGIGVTSDGWIVFADGEAVVSPEFDVVVGSWYDVAPATRVIETSLGEFRITDGVIVTPSARIYRLSDLRHLATEN